MLNCKPSPKNEDATETTKKDSVQFYPLNYFWSSQLREIDSSPFYIYKIITGGKKKDSAEIDNATCRQLASYFSAITTDDEAFKKNYTETIFRDESTASITFNYTTKVDTASLKSIDILLDNTTQDVKRIFIKKFYSRGDTLFTESAGWKTSSRFYINKSAEIKSKTVYTNQLTVVWNQNN